MDKMPKLKCTLNVNNYSDARCKICCRVCDKYERCTSPKKCFNHPSKCNIAITPEMQIQERNERWHKRGSSDKEKRK